MLQLRQKYKEEITFLRNYLKRWTSHRSHRTHPWCRLEVSDIISHFNVSIISTMSLWRSARFLNIFCEGNVMTSKLWSSGFHKIYFYYESKSTSRWLWSAGHSFVFWNYPHTRPLPLLHNYSPVIWSVSAQSLSKSLNIPSPCIHSLRSKILRPSYKPSHSLLDMFLRSSPTYNFLSEIWNIWEISLSPVKTKKI